MARWKRFITNYQQISPINRAALRQILMQTPPPLSNLLLQLITMGSNVSQLKEDSNYDWNWRPDQDDWSLTEVLCHLRDVEGEVHQPRFVAVLERKDPFLPGASADEWAKVRGYRDQDGRGFEPGHMAAARNSCLPWQNFPARAALPGNSARRDTLGAD